MFCFCFGNIFIFIWFTHNIFSMTVSKFAIKNWNLGGLDLYQPAYWSIGWKQMVVDRSVVWILCLIIFYFYSKIYIKFLLFCIFWLFLHNRAKAMTQMTQMIWWNWRSQTSLWTPWIAWMIWSTSHAGLCQYYQKVN